MSFSFTSSGVKFTFPARPENVRVGDIAHALAKICRYNGHCLRHYSVAEHTVRGYDIARELGFTMPALRHWYLHDTAEAYVGDMIRPLKTRQFAKREETTLKAIYKAAGASWDQLAKYEASVKLIDDLMLEAEIRHLCSVAAYDHFYVTMEERWVSRLKDFPSRARVTSVDHLITLLDRVFLLEHPEVSNNDYEKSFLRNATHLGLFAGSA